MAAQANAKVIPIDVGIAAEETPEGVWNKKVSRGTKNFLKQPAMTEEEALAAIEAGIDSVKKCKEDGVTLLATGEMGIGNTTTSSAVAAALLNCETAAITGKGAGLSDAGLLHKIAVIDEARKKYQFDSKDVFRILCSVGGLDIAGLCGVCIGGAVYGCAGRCDQCSCSTCGRTSCSGRKGFSDRFPQKQGTGSGTDLTGTWCTSGH